MGEPGLLEQLLILRAYKVAENQLNADPDETDILDQLMTYSYRTTGIPNGISGAGLQIDTTRPEEVGCLPYDEL